MPKGERCALMNNLKAGARLLRIDYFTVLCAAISVHEDLCMRTKVYTGGRRLQPGNNSNTSSLR